MQLGPFLIESFVAAGGNGVVFRARHARSGTPVAIKAVPMRGDQLRREVRLELEALAGLAHRHIVWIHDFGRVAQGFELGGHSIGEGWVWMAMELGEVGFDTSPPEGWEATRRATLELLSALAYAHARGVLHRDVKPANVLRTREGRLKLSDFGLAVIDGRTATRAAGTAKYMAPEQQLGDLPQLGPWTDLYALGVTVWRWVCGEPPFVGNSQRMLFAKLQEQLQPFQPRFAVPRGLEAWLQVCLRASPFDRFEHAADARYALAQLGPVSRTGAARASRAEAEAPTVVAAPVKAELPAAKHERPPVAPVTTAWQGDTVDAGPLLNVGLELFGLRSLQTVGREVEQQRLWNGLIHVHRQQRPELAVLSGPPGMGSSHLMRSLAERAHAAGVAYRIELIPDDGDRSRATLRALFGTGEEVDQRFERHRGQFDVDPGFVEQLRVVCDSDEGDAATVLAQVIGHQLHRRAVVLEIEDVQLGADALLDPVLALQGPVLVVATAPEDALDTLVDRGQTTLKLSPLQSDDNTRLCRSLLGLEPQLALRLAELSDGNPGFAVQICDHWVRLGILEAGEEGYELVAGASASVPDLPEWNEQVDRIALEPGALDALRIAAHLGRQVSLETLRAVAPGQVDLDRLVARMVDQRLVRRTEQGFEWSLRAFREAVLRQPVEDPRQLASVAADALEGLDDRAPERADALVAAERWAEAEAALVDCIARADDEDRHVDVLAMMSGWEKLITARSAIPAAAESVEIARLRALRAVGSTAQLEEALPDAEILAQARGWAHLERWVELLKVPTLPVSERPAHIAALLERLEQVEPGVVHVEALHDAAQSAQASGDLARAVAHYERAIAIASSLGLRAEAFFRIALGQTLLKMGQHEQAIEVVRAGRELAVLQRAPFSEFFGWFQEGMVHLALDDFEQAAACFDTSAGIARRIGEHQEWYVRSCSGMCQRLAGDRDGARRTFVACLNAPSRSGHLFSHIGMLTLEIDDVAFERHWGFVRERWIDSGRVDSDVARMLGEAGDTQLEAGHTQRALTLYQALRGQLEGLGRPTDALDALVARLS